MESPVTYFRKIISEFDISNGFIDDVWWERSLLFEEEDGTYSGRVDLGFRLRGISGGNFQFRVPIFIQKGKIIQPSLVFYNNEPFVLNQTLFNKFLSSSVFYDIPHGSWMDVEREFFYLKQPRDNKVLNRYSALILECIKADNEVFRNFLSGEPVIKKEGGFKKQGQLLDAIFAAIEHRRLMKFYYVNKKGESGYRVVEPHYIWETKNGDWLLIAWDRKKDGWRSFYLDELDDVRVKIKNRFEPYDKFLGRVTLYRITREKIPASEGDFFTERGPIHPRSIRKVRGESMVEECAMEDKKVEDKKIDLRVKEIMKPILLPDGSGCFVVEIGRKVGNVELERELRNFEYLKVPIDEAIEKGRDADMYVGKVDERGCRFIGLAQTKEGRYVKWRFWYEKDGNIYSVGASSKSEAMQEIMERWGRVSVKVSSYDELDERFKIVDEFKEYNVEAFEYALWDDTLKMVYDFWVSQGKPRDVVIEWDYIDRSSHMPVNLRIKPKGEEWEVKGTKYFKIIAQNDIRMEPDIRIELWVDYADLEYNPEIEKIRESDLSDEEKIKNVRTVAMHIAQDKLSDVKSYLAERGIRIGEVDQFDIILDEIDWNKLLELKVGSMKMVADMDYEEKLQYAKDLLRNNIFYEFELPYYAGLTGKMPHGIEDEIWQDAFKEVGINVWNKDKTDFVHISDISEVEL